MEWHGKVAGIVASAVLSFGVYSTDAIRKIESDPAALYLAGQFWVIAGQRECGLELIDRAARATQHNSAKTVSAPASEAAPQMCSRQPVPRRESKPNVMQQPRMMTAALVARPALTRAAYREAAEFTNMPAPPAAANLARVNELVAAKMFAVSNAQQALTPDLEIKVRQIEAEARSRAFEHMSRAEKSRALEQELRVFLQKS